ncbi:MAG: DUF368 domain-containing protein [Ruminococcaceae bacterium]|nr:DUF368 domain-containing protein [Oscillospiraceae bacterium]
MKNLLGIIYGAVFGVANVIPGVSGGTMLVAFGCYDKVCGALALDFKEIKKNIKFLIFFAIGAALGIVGFSNIITLLFEKFPTETYMFFIGLILGSVPLIIRNATIKEKFRPVCAVPFIIALGLVIGLAVLENSSSDPMPVTEESIGNDYYEITVTNNSSQTVNEWWLEIEGDRNHDGFGGIFDFYSNDESVKVTNKQGFIDKLMGKSGDDVIVPAGSAEIKPGESVTFTIYVSDYFILTPKYSYTITPMFIATIILASFAAAVAMIIPGVSGSFIMVLLGTYSTVISAVKDFNFAVIIPTAAGVLLGLVFGAKLIRLLLNKARLMVFSAILGMCAGSLYAILPEGFGLNIDTLIGVFALVLGGVISYFVGKNTKVEE